MVATHGWVRLCYGDSVTISATNPFAPTPPAPVEIGPGRGADQFQEATLAEHATDLTGIAVVMTMAVLLGLIFVHMRQPAIVGYIVTGLLLGPTGFGLVSSTDSVTLLAELGVIMLLFLIGMEISIRAFISVLRPAVMVAGAQMAIALAVTFAFSSVLGWTAAQAILLGFIVAVSSTAVAMKMLEEIGELRTQTGRITIGVLIAQDIAIVPMLLVIDSFSAEGHAWGMVAVKLVVSVVALGLLIAFLGRRGKFAMPFSGAIQGKVDIVALASLAFCFGGAATSGLFGLSPAYGAFVAGLIIAGSTMRTEAIHATHPIQSILMVVFFLSIGLLIDLDYIVDNFTLVLSFVLGVILIKTVVNVAILHMVGEPWERAFPSGLIMAQIGEFSFVLAAAGWKVGEINGGGYRLAIAVIAISLLISPLWMVTVRRFHDLAQDEISDLRTALADVYADEIGGFGRRVHLLRITPYLTRRRLRKLVRAWRRSRVRRAMRARMQEAAGSASAMHLMGTADSYPVDDEEKDAREMK